MNGRVVEILASTTTYFFEHENLLNEVLDEMIESTRPEPGDTPAMIFGAVASALASDPNKATTIAALAIMRLAGVFDPAGDPA